MSKRIFLLILTVGLISVIFGVTMAWFHDTGVSRDNVLKAGTWSYDVAVISIYPSKTIVGQGYNMRINVTVTNEGDFTETFDVTAYANTTVIETQEINLASGDSTTITITWDTTGFTYSSYGISAYATPVLGETDTSDNTYTNGNVLVTIPGDVNGDRIVDIFDIGSISSHWYPSSPVGPLGFDGNADINNDNAVDIFDIDITSAHWGETW